MRRKITLDSINEKVNRQQKEIRDLRDTLFKWGQQNMKDIDEIKKQLSEENLLESKT